MGTNDTAVISTATRDNILNLIDGADGREKTSKYAVARKAGIPMTTFDRRLEHPERLTIKEAGDIAAALGVSITDILRLEAA